MINRKRPGKKIVDAPSSILIYDDDAEEPLHSKSLIARISFYDEGGFKDPSIEIHSRGQITVIAHENQKGGKIELKENPQGTHRWAEIQPPSKAEQ